MIGHIILNNSAQNGTKGTFIIETIILSTNKISISTFLMNVMQFTKDILIVLDPIFVIKHED